MRIFLSLVITLAFLQTQTSQADIRFMNEKGASPTWVQVVRNPDATLSFIEKNGDRALRYIGGQKSFTLAQIEAKKSLTDLKWDGENTKADGKTVFGGFISGALALKIMSNSGFVVNSKNTAELVLRSGIVVTVFATTAAVGGFLTNYFCNPTNPYELVHALLGEQSLTPGTNQIITISNAETAINTLHQTLKN